MLPIVLALIVCDDVWIDPTSQKQTILGAYGAIAAKTFPHVIPRLSIYIALTEGSPSTKIRVRVIDVDELRAPVIDGEQGLTFADPREVHQGTVRAPMAVFPEPGEYRVQLFADDEILLERRLLLLDLNETIHD